MATFEFPYESFALRPSDPFPNGTTAHRPILLVELISPATKQPVDCAAIVDSGADHCLFPLSFATLLGLDPLALKKNTTGGVGSTNITYYADIGVVIPMSSGVRLLFSTYAGFTDAMDAHGIGLLGQTGFFENFKTTFDHRRKVFTIDDDKP